MMKARNARLMITALLSTTAAGAAAAQEAAPAGAPSAQDAAAPAGASAQVSAQDGGGLSDIIVTATRREENLQRTALPISAISAGSLARLGVTQAENLSGAVTGLNISPNGAVNQLFLRGVGTYAIAGYTDSSVAFNVDGVFYSFPSQIGGSFYDVARIEVLKGPQGTLYGRNASAGAINVITNRPQRDFGASASLELGNYDQRKLNGMINIPLGEKAAFRTAGEIVRRDGFYSDGVGKERSESIRAELLIEPTDDLSVLLTGDYTHSGGDGTPFVPRPAPQPGKPYLGPSTALSNMYLRAFNAQLPPFAQVPLDIGDSSINVKSWGIHAEINLDLDFGTLTFLPAYRKLTDVSKRFPGFIANNDDDGHQSSAELRLSSAPGGAFKWIVGGYFFDNHYVYRLTIDQGTNFDDAAARQNSRTFAGFGEATLSLADTFRVTGGVRYTSERKKQAGFYNSTTLLPPLAKAYDLAGVETYNNVSFKGGIEYDLAPRSMAYATVSRGFKAGGFNLDAAPNSYRPETLTAYTLGLKNRLFDNRVQANFEAFYWDYKDHQEIFLQALNAGGFAPKLVNLPKSTLYGFNADLEFQLSRNDLLSVQVEYLNAQLDEFAYTLPSLLAPAAGVSTTCAISNPAPGLSTIDCGGKPFTRAPKWSANLGYQHIFDLAGGGKIVAAVDTQLKTGQDLTIDYIPLTRQKGYSMTNLNLTYTTASGKFTVAAYVRNLEDEAVASGGFQRPRVPGLLYQTLRAPRTYGGSIGVKF